MLAAGNVTPYERLYKEKSNLGGVPEWGQRVWVHNASGNKLDARALEGLEARWVGFDFDSPRAHRIYWPGNNSVSVERNVKFVLTTEAMRVPFPLLPEGEQQSQASKWKRPHGQPVTPPASTSARSPPEFLFQRQRGEPLAP